MAAKEPIFVVIRASGKVWPLKVEVGYFGILRSIYIEYQSAGSGWDRPSKLLFNGEMVVTERLADLAREYCMAFDTARFAAADRTDANFRPAWMPEKSEES